MQLPLEITCDNVPRTDELERFVHDEAAKLDRYHPRIMRCRVGITRINEHVTGTNPYHVRVQCTVPAGNEVIAVRHPNESDPHDPLTAVVANAFEAAGRQLRKLGEKQRGDNRPARP